MTSIRPPDHIQIIVCLGTSGLASGAEAIAMAFEDGLKKAKVDGKIDKDHKVVRTGDRGLFKDPLVDVWVPGGNRVTYDLVTLDKVKRILDEHIIGGTPVKDLIAGDYYSEFFNDQNRIVLQNCGEIDPENIDDYIQRDGFKGLAQAFSMTPEEVTEEVRGANIRGRGGAGFPAGVKWGFARKAKADQKYFICNADEGDPGAFMDRSVLEGDPFAVLEGMIIAGYAIGATKGFVYCRAEYPVALARVSKAIETAREVGYLGENILGSGFSFDISLKQGAGAFVCGEETALIASIEGKRGMPMPRPPFPANKGLWGKPTIINNVETLSNIPKIMRNGKEWYQGIGVEGNTGTKVFALAGKVKNTGLVEVPMGTTIREVIFGPGGGMLRRKFAFKAVQMGGPSGGCLPESLLDTSIDYESITKTGAIMGSGGMIVMDESTCMVDIARFFLTFTVSESCGKCVPCREGLRKMLTILERITEGQGTSSDIDTLDRLARTIKDTALCGLGNTAPNPVLTTLRYFKDEYEAHIKEKVCPARVCTALLKFEVDYEACTKCGLCFKECPSDAIEWEKGSKARILKDKCIKCRSCIQACKFKAIN